MNIDPGQPSLNPIQAPPGTTAGRAVKTGKGISQLPDQIGQSTSRSGVDRAVKEPPNNPTLQQLSDVRSSLRLATATLKLATGGNKFLAPSALVSLTIALYKLASLRSKMALQEGLLSADFTKVAQDQTESLGKLIREIAQVKADDLRMKAIMAGVSAAMSFGVAIKGASMMNKAAAAGGQLGHMESAILSSTGQGMQSLTQVVTNASSADAAIKEGALESVKVMAEFAQQQTQKAGQAASNAADEQKRDHDQLLQLLDKFTDSLTKWHGQRG